MRVLPDWISLPILLIQLTISDINYKPSNYKRLNVKFHFKMYLVQDRLPSSHCPLFNISLYGNHFLLEWGRVYFQFDSCWEKYSTVSRKEFHYSRIIQLTAGGNNHAAIRKQLTVCVNTEQPVSDAQSGGLETTIRTPVKCPMSFFCKPHSGTQRLFPPPWSNKMQIRTDFLATRGATQRECAQPCNLPSSLGSLWRKHRSHAFLLLGNRTEAAPPRGKGEKGGSSDSGSKGK